MRRLPNFSLAHVSLAFVGLMWTLPFLQPRHYFPLPMFDSEWLAFTLGLVALAPLAARGAWQNTRLPAIAFVPLGLMAFVLLQAGFGRVIYAAQAYTAALYLAWAALLIMLGAALKREFGTAVVVPALAWFVVAGGELNALAALLQYYDVFSVYDPLVTPRISGRIYGNLAQANLFADYTALAVASIAYLHATARVGWAGAACAALPLLFVLGLSGSRSAWVYLLGLFVLASWLRLRHDQEQHRRFFSCVGLMVIGFYAAQLAARLPWLTPASGGVMLAMDALSAGGLAERLDIWRAAWWMFLQAPVTGVGWGQFAWHDFEFRALFGSRFLIPTQNAHNLPLHLLAETGLIGALWVVAGLALWLRRACKDACRAETGWLLALFVIVGAHSLLEFPLWHAFFLGVAAIGLGLGETRGYVLNLPRIAPLATAALLALGFVNAAVLRHNYDDFQRMFVLGGNPLPSEEIIAIVRRGQRDPVLEPYADLAGSAYILVEPDQLENKLELNDRVMRFMPKDIVVYRHALLLAMGGQPDAARELFVRAVRVYPDILPRVTVMLRKLAAEHPAQFAPLLELAIAKSAERGPGALAR